MKKLFLSDVDGTLVKRSLMLSHAGFLLKHGLISDNGIYDAWRQDVKNEDLISHLAEHYRFEIIGKTVNDLHVSDYLSTYLANNNNVYSTLEKLCEEKEKGNDVHLVSGSPDFLVERLAMLYGFEWKSSKYYTNKNAEFTGKVKGMYSKRQKQNYVKKLDLSDYSHITALGDTKSDEGLFVFGDYNILVDPSQQTKETIKVPIHELIFN